MGVRKVYTDDLTGAELKDGERNIVSLVFQGKAYRLDLNAASLAKMEKALEPFTKPEFTDEADPIEKAQTRRGRSATLTKEPARTDLKDIREWAKKNGKDVADKGRISADIIKAYDEAH